MRRQILEAVDMTLYVLSIILDQARKSIQARRDDAERARRLRRAHPRGVRGDRS